MTLHNTIAQRLTKKERLTHPAVRFAISLGVILSLWQLVVVVFAMPSFILPSPVAVFERLIVRHAVLLKNTWITAQEMVLGLGMGLAMGLLFALLMLLFTPLKRWLLPILIASQAIPVFAMAPVLMLWLGYGIASKVVISAIILFFPVTTCCYDGLRNTPTGYLDLAKTMEASKWQLLREIQFPASLPTLASGVRVAVVMAPIGAVVGEWVGSSGGLGYLMIQANARMIIDEMFAALCILAVLSVTLYFVTDTLLKKWIPWENQ